MILSRFIEAIRNGSADPWWDSVVHGGKGDSQDYSASAEKQAQSSQGAQAAATWANRPTQTTPWGTSSWTTGSAIDPATGKTVTTWNQNLELNPEQQKAFNAQQATQVGRSQTAQGLMGQVTDATEQPFDWSNLPSMPGSIADAQKGAYNTMEAAIEPQRNRQRSAQQTQLANMGLSMDSQAYKNAVTDQEGNFAQADRGMLAQALSEGRADTQAQQGLRQAAISDQAQRRQMPLNELNALLTGQQVSQPSMPSFGPAGAAQGADYLGAAGMQGAANRANQTDWGSIAGGVGMAIAMY